MRSGWWRWRGCRGRRHGGLDPIVIAGITLIVILVDRHIVFEPGVLADKAQQLGADRAVTLLADNDFCDSLLLGVLVIDLVTVDKEDDVGILLDRS